MLEGKIRKGSLRAQSGKITVCLSFAPSFNLRRVTPYTETRWGTLLRLQHTLGQKNFVGLSHIVGLRYPFKNVLYQCHVNLFTRLSNWCALILDRKRVYSYLLFLCKVFTVKSWFFLWKGCVMSSIVTNPWFRYNLMCRLYHPYKVRSQVLFYHTRLAGKRYQKLIWCMSKLCVSNQTRTVNHIFSIESTYSTWVTSN